MGIQYLNKYLTSNCCNGIERITLDDLRNKKIAIDISIYLYDYKSRGDLIEFIYKMVLELISRDITPVFVFDGKPPPEKKILLAKRRREKNEAHCEIEKLNKLINTKPSYSNDYKVISVVKGMKIYWNKVSWRVNNSKKFSESGLLKLNSNKAKKILKWKNYLDFKKTVKFVGEWYNDYYTKSKNSYIISNKQIDIYEKYLN